jgi:hypothetical protein
MGGRSIRSKVARQEGRYPRVRIARRDDDERAYPFIGIHSGHLTILKTPGSSDEVRGRNASPVTECLMK